MQHDLREDHNLRSLTVNLEKLEFPVWNPVYPGRYLITSSQSGCSVRRRTAPIESACIRQSGVSHLLEISQCPASGDHPQSEDPPCRALDVRKAGEGRWKRHVGLRPDGAAARHARADASSRRPRVCRWPSKRKVDDAPRRVEFEEVRIGVRAQRVDGEVAPRVDPGGDARTMYCMPVRPPRAKSP